MGAVMRSAFVRFEDWPLRLQAFIAAGRSIAAAASIAWTGAIVRGRNVISMQGIGTDEGRHSVYIAYGQCNTVSDFESSRSLKAQAKDAEIRKARDDAARQAQEAAKRLGLNYVYHLVGYGDLADAIRDAAHV